MTYFSFPPIDIHSSNDLQSNSPHWRGLLTIYEDVTGQGGAGLERGVVRVVEVNDHILNAIFQLGHDGKKSCTINIKKVFIDHWLRKPWLKFIFVISKQPARTFLETRV